MIIKTLIENHSVSTDYVCEHGLSFYIETNGIKILFDMGKTDLFSQNARKMGIRLSEIDIAVISHGHYDHGGGLSAFLECNHKAKVYVAKGAFDPKYAVRDDEKVYIGLDRYLRHHPQVVEIEGLFKVMEGITLFSDVSRIHPLPRGNKNLLAVTNGQFVEDSFNHEQNLWIEEGDSNVIIAGCAHRGIANIMEYSIKEFDIEPSVVVGGFHLKNRVSTLSEKPELVDQIGQYLKEKKSMYYTCHCTGVEAFHRLKNQLGDRLGYLASGSVLHL